MVAGSQAEWVAQAGTDGRMFHSEKGRHLPYTRGSLEAGKPPSELEREPPGEPPGEPRSEPAKPSSIYYSYYLDRLNSLPAINKHLKSEYPLLITPYT